MATLADLHRRIDAVRRQERNVILFTGIFKSLLALVAVVLGYFLTDWLFDLPYYARLICAGLGLSGIAFVVNKHLLRELRRIRDDDEIALRIERRNPNLRGRLISTLQLSKAEQSGSYIGSQELLAALEDETITMSAPLDFSGIINTDTLKRFGAAAAIVLLVKGALLFRFPDYFSALGSRLVHADGRFPTKTRIAEVKCPKFVARGDDIVVTVELDPNSVVPADSGTINFSGLESGNKVGISMSKVNDGVYSGTLAKPSESMAFIVVIGDARSQPGQVEVKPRPEVDVQGSAIQYKPPAYTRLPAADDKFGSLTTLAGSSAHFSIKATKPLVSAQIKRSDGAVSELKKTDDAGFQWALDGFMIDKSGSYHVELLDKEGLCNSQPSIEYSIDARPDLAPSVKITKPARDITVIRTAKRGIAFSARDDFNVRTVWLVYQVTAEGAGAGAKPEIKRYEMPNFPQGKEINDAKFTWDLSQLNLKAGDLVTFWLEADDDCPGNDTEPMRQGKPLAGTTIEARDPKAKYYPRSNDVKLTVLTNEEKIQEFLTEQNRLFGEVETTKAQQEELIRKTIQLLESHEK
jgi:hypothetical protein